MLEELLAGSLDDARARMERRPLRQVEADALARPAALDALEALAPAERIRVIAEVKRASPSRGELAEIAEPQSLAAQYEAGGASAVSVLTEERRFKGSLDDLEAVRKAVSIPVLRKDFIGDEYQVLEARAAGADLVLLIVAALPQDRLERLYELIRQLGMTPLVEAHSADEVARAVDLGSELIGVNARDLRTFELDRELFGRVADQIPAGVIRVAESAVLDVADVQRYREAGADAVLVGEALVTGDPIATLGSFLSV
ncbi:indole-3-glycerol phosphate synthase TrpC [Leucobacter massiliensis]|uniref:indole-3-glycerol-phosphate synthase n=1 Tax=Leucobacter massiliensis TaxID=1686285 RepID=A0A2S9QQ96_9MICO|nr:indole-3-glycerol phosphate synthase TrpC [Leucobacter massiliensis]PRI11755.1 indole-3-glycerol phosphate synthase [Leucobacter massiliensis]